MLSTPRSSTFLKDRAVAATLAGILIASLVAPAPAAAQRKGQEVPIVANGRRGSMRAAPTLNLLAEMGQEGPEESLFYQPNDLFFGPDGNVYISDVGNSTISVFDREGGFVRRIGRQGSGPGEFQRPMGAYINEAELLVVPDPMNQRTTYFKLDGEFVGSDPMNQGGGLVIISSTARIPIGNGEYLRNSMGGIRIMQSSGGGNRDVDVRVGSLPEVDETPLAEVVNEAGEVVRSFGERKPYEDQRLGMLGNAVVLAYSPENGEVALVFRTSEEIHIYDPRTGEPKRIITREIPFTPRVPSFEEQRISSPDGREVQIMVQPIADTVSRAAAYDAQGRLWVIAMLLDYDELTEREEEGDYAGMSRLEVYAPDGTLLTAVVMEDPSDRIVFDDSGDLWLLDTQYEALLRRYEVHWPQ